MKTLNFLTGVESKLSVLEHLSNGMEDLLNVMEHLFVVVEAKSTVMEDLSGDLEPKSTTGGAQISCRGKFIKRSGRKIK